MKKVLVLVLAVVFLAGCGEKKAGPPQASWCEVYHQAVATGMTDNEIFSYMDSRNAYDGYDSYGVSHRARFNAEVRNC